MFQSSKWFVRVHLLLTAMLVAISTPVTAQVRLTVEDSAVLLSALDTSMVPVWDNGEIDDQFVRIRDARYLYQNDDHNTPARRIPWLNPAGGAEARADLAIYQIMADIPDHLDPPAKIWAIKHATWTNDDSLQVFTNNDLSGSVEWNSHVAPIVQNHFGVFYVLDPALSPCKPLVLSSWLALMVDDVNKFNDSDMGYTVAVSDYQARHLDDLAVGEPGAGTHLAESESDVQNYHLWQEWDVQVNDLGRNFNDMFGATPAWATEDCRTIEETAVRMSRLDYSEVSVWTDEQILTQFLRIRDDRHLSHVSCTSAACERRITWLDPVLDCNTRAELSVVHILSSDDEEIADLPPYKIHAVARPDGISPFDDLLGVDSPNYPENRLDWSSHVAVAVQNTAGQLIVFDPALEPCRPLHWQEWLGMMVDDVNEFDAVWDEDEYSGFRVAISDRFADSASSLPFNEPEAPLYRQNAIDRATSGSLLSDEWQNQLSAYKFNYGETEGEAQFNAVTDEMFFWDEPSWYESNCAPHNCSESTATDMGAPFSSMAPVAGNACLKITHALPSWVGSIVLQSQANGTEYPIPYTFTNCATTGAVTITRDWSSSQMTPIDHSCTTIIKLDGSAASTVSLKWWPNG